MKKCPNCGKPVEWQDNPARPFCSERCKLIDFGRWANEEFRVPAEPASPDDLIEIPTAPVSSNGDTTSH